MTSILRSDSPPNKRMEPARQTVPCDHVVTARGSFAALDGQLAPTMMRFEARDLKPRIETRQQEGR